MTIQEILEGATTCTSVDPISSDNYTGRTKIINDVSFDPVTVVTTQEILKRAIIF